MPKFQDEIDVVQSNTLSKQGSPITTPPSSTENLMIINTLAAGANHPANKATRFLEGAVLTITNPHLSVDSTLYSLIQNLQNLQLMKRRLQKLSMEQML